MTPEEQATREYSEAHIQFGPFDVSLAEHLKREGVLTCKDALIALRDGIDTSGMHCEPVPVTSSWRYVIDKALGGPS